MMPRLENPGTPNEATLRVPDLDCEDQGGGDTEGYAPDSVLNT